MVLGDHGTTEAVGSKTQLDMDSVHTGDDPYTQHKPLDMAKI